MSPATRMPSLEIDERSQMTSTMSDRKLQPTFRITTPGDWVVLDLDAIDAFDASSSKLPEQLASPARYIQRTARVFRESGVLYGAFMLERGSRESIATVSALIVVGPPDESGNLETLVSENPPADAVEGSFRVDTFQLATNESIRAECLRRSVLELPSSAAVSFAVQYFIRVPERADLLVVSFATPNAALADKYRHLFDSIARSIEFSSSI